MREVVNFHGSITITPNGETSYLVGLGNVMFRFDFILSDRWKVSLLRSLDNSKKEVPVGEIWTADFKIALKEFFGFNSFQIIQA
jgi:hypothetical protein